MQLPSSPALLAFTKAQETSLTGRYSEAKKLALDALADARKRGDRAGEALLMVAVASAVTLLTDEDQALPMLREALALAQQAKAPLAEAHARLRIGSILEVRDEYPASQRELELGLALARQLKDKELEVQYLVELATTLESLEKTDESRKLFQTALQLAVGIKAPRLILTQIRFAQFLTQIGEFTEAKEQLTKAQQGLRAYPLPISMLAINMTLARIAVAQKQFERAFPLMSAARKQANALGVQRWETKIILAQADLYDDLDQGPSTVKTALEGLAIAKKSGSRWDEALAHLILSYGYYDIDNFSEAVASASQTLAIAEKLGLVYYQVRALLSLCSNQASLRQYDLALQSTERGLKLSVNSPDKEARKSLFSALAGIHLAQEHYDKARDVLKAQMAETTAPTDKARFLAQLASVYFREKKYAEVVSTTQEMEALAVQAKDLPLTAQAWRIRAGGLDGLGKSSEAITALEKAQRLFQEQKDQDNEAETLSAVAQIHLREDRYSQAEDTILKAADLYQKNGGALAAGRALLSIAGYLYQREKYSEAGRLLEKALPAVLEAKAAREQAVVFHYLGGIQTHDELYEKALDSFEKSLALYREIKDRANEAQILRGIASILDYQGQEDRAKEYIEKAKAIEATLGDKKVD